MFLLGVYSWTDPSVRGRTTLPTSHFRFVGVPLPFSAENWKEDICDVVTPAKPLTRSVRSHAVLSPLFCFLQSAQTERNAVRSPYYFLIITNRQTFQLIVQVRLHWKCFVCVSEKIDVDFMMNPESSDGRGEARSFGEAVVKLEPSSLYADDLSSEFDQYDQPTSSTDLQEFRRKRDMRWINCKICLYERQLKCSEMWT